MPCDIATHCYHHCSTFVARPVRTMIVSNAISTYAECENESVDRMKSNLKPVKKDIVVAGVYKDDDSQYSLDNLLKKQKEGDLQ